MQSSINRIIVAMAIALIVLLGTVTIWRKEQVVISLALLVTTIGIATAEEWLFRRGLQRFLMSRYSARKSALLTAVAFALAHLPQYGIAPQIGIIAFGALALSAVYEITRSVSACAAIHTLWNVTNRGNRESAEDQLCKFSFADLSCVETNGFILFTGWVLTFFIILLFFYDRRTQVQPQDKATERMS